MDPRTEHPDSMPHSPYHSVSSGQWSPPPPQFQEDDEIQAVEHSPQLHYARTHSPSARSPPLQHYQHSPPQEYQGVFFDRSNSTTKKAPYATHMNIDTTTPDYSAPEVVVDQNHGHFHGNTQFSPVSYGGLHRLSHQTSPYSFKEHVDPYESMSRPESVPPPVPSKDDRKCGMKRRTFWVLLGCFLAGLVAVGVGLGVGLTLGLKKESKTENMDPVCRANPQLCIGGALNSDYISKTGAFNGSGIALAGESWNKEAGRLFTLYFQHHTGKIRYMQYTREQQWIGGTEKETVATDAKDATPISAVSYALNLTQYFHIFYIANDNTVKQVTLTNVSTTWQPGPLSDLNLKAHDSPSVGLQACWKGNFYGDSDYKNFPVVTGGQNDVPFENQAGMNMWYALDDATFEQYAWYSGSNEWKAIKKWAGFSTHAGVGCYSWGPGTTQYAMLVNRDAAVEVYWKDTNQSSTAGSTDAHPINSWQNASTTAIPDVYPATSLGYTTYFYAQSADRSIRGYNVSFSAENTTIVPEDTFTVRSPAQPVYALGGTHLTVTSVATKDTGGFIAYDSLYVFFQTTGDDITAATRPIQGGEWSIAPLVIPNE